MGGCVEVNDHDYLGPMQGSLESTTTEDHSGGEEGSSSDDGRVPRRCSSKEGANHMADLARMTSMRNLNANIVPPVRGGHRRGQPSVASASVGNAERNEQPAVGVPGHSDKTQVEDFFRQVNEDAHLLKRMGSDGFHGCGGLLLRGVTCCLRKAGLGNPGASVENMAFDVQGDNMSVTGAALSGDFVVDDDAEVEDDEGADAQILSVQKKKVHDLGELPALDWSHVSRNLLFSVVAISVLLLTTLSNALDKCIQLGSLCLRQWLNMIAVAVGAYFLIEILAKLVASFLKWTRILHANNKAWIFIKLHKNVSLLIWSAMLFGLWLWFKTTSYFFYNGGLITQFLGCFLAYAAVDVVSEICKVKMADQYMWRPYLERARTSIWSQYVMFMMTDHAMGVPTKDAEGQALALGFTRAKNLGDNVSLYTVGKAIGFVHANALRHPLGAGRPGTDKEGMINSKTGARLFGGLLFDALALKFDADAGRIKCDTGGCGTSSTSKPDTCNARYSATEPVEACLPRPLASRRNCAMKKQSPMRGKLSSVTECKETRHEEEHKQGTGDHRLGGGDLAEEDEDGRASTSTEKEDNDNNSRWSSLPPPGSCGDAAAVAPASAEDLARARTASPPPHSHHQCQQQQQQQQQQKQQKQKKGHERGGTAGGLSGSNQKELTGGVPRRRGSVPGGGAGYRGITLGNLRQMTSKAIALQIMELFEMPPDGLVTRKVFIDRMVDVFVQRRSLQLTLGDYEAILKKVGYLLNVLSAVIVFFVSLRVFGYNISSLVLTWLSLAVAFSFLFGSSASAFFESIIFVFVTKAYDVGDPVYFVDDTGTEDWYIITRINMLTTVFRRWDGQATQIANNIMAKKAIRNQWRSGPFVHHTMLSVSVETPTEKLDLMKAGIAAGMRRGRHRHRHGTGGLLPDTVDYSVKGLTDGNRLAVFVLCKQRENSSNMSRRFSNGNLFLKLVAHECNKHCISYTLPPQPVSLGGGGSGRGNQILHAREAFLGGEESSLAGGR